MVRKYLLSGGLMQARFFYSTKVRQLDGMSMLLRIGLLSIAAFFAHALLSRRRRTLSSGSLPLRKPAGSTSPTLTRRRYGSPRKRSRTTFPIDYIQNTDKIDDAFLSHYQLFIQLNYPPYMWTPTAQAAFIKYIEQGKGGWIGFHHATPPRESTATPCGPGFLTSWAYSLQGLHCYVRLGKVNVEACLAPRDERRTCFLQDRKRGVVHLR